MNDSGKSTPREDAHERWAGRDDRPAEASGDVADRNLEQLLRRAYRPEQVDADFARRVTGRLVEAARARAEARPRGVGRVVFWSGLAAAAAVALVVFVADRLRPPISRPQPKSEAKQPARAREKARLARALRQPNVLAPRPRPAAPAPQTVAVGTVVRTRHNQRRRLVLEDRSVLYVNQDTLAKVAGPRRLELRRGEIYVEVAHDAAAGFAIATPSRQVTAVGTRLAVRVRDGRTGVLVTQGKVRVSGRRLPLYAGQQLRGDDSVAPLPRATYALAWTRDLMAAAESPLVPKSEYAGGALVAIDPQGQEMRLSLRRFHVDVYIEDGFVRTTIDQTYFNHATWRLEGTFYFPLPPDASLSRLAMYVNGRLNEGGMVERSRARRVYESIVHRMQDPALLEWVDGSTFKMRVFPLEPRREKRIVLSYTQKLPMLYGQGSYRFPAGHTMQNVNVWSFRARVKGAAGQAWVCDSHEMTERIDGDDLVLEARQENVPPDTDVVLEFPEYRAGPAEGEAKFYSATYSQHRYLMVRYRPELPGAAAGRRQRRHWVFLFERSGDRDTLVARAQIEIVRGLLAHAGAGDTFAVVTAGTRTAALADRPLPVTPENVDLAMEFLEGTHLVGALDLEAALRAGVAQAAGRANACLVHLGAGVPVLGTRRQDKLVERLPSDLTYVGVGVGKRYNRGFMKAAAARTGGFYTQINPDEELTWRSFELSATLNTPRLLNVRVTAGDGQAFLARDDSAAEGEELCAILRLGKDEALPKRVTFRGALDGEAWSAVLAVRDVATKCGYIPRTWVRLEIDRLVAEGAGKNRKRIVALSKAMYVMSPFTSLLVLENEKMYKEHNVERGRKDHWAMYPCPAKIKVVHEPLRGAATKKKAKTEEAEPWYKRVLQSILIRVRPPFFQRPGDSQPSHGCLRSTTGTPSAWQLYTGAYALARCGAFEHAHVAAREDYRRVIERYSAWVRQYFRRLPQWRREDGRFDTLSSLWIGGGLGGRRLFLPDRPDAGEAEFLDPVMLRVTDAPALRLLVDEDRLLPLFRPEVDRELRLRGFIRTRGEGLDGDEKTMPWYRLLRYPSNWGEIAAPVRLDLTTYNTRTWMTLEGIDVDYETTLLPVLTTTPVTGRLFRYGGNSYSSYITPRSSLWQPASLYDHREWDLYTTWSRHSTTRFDYGYSLIDLSALRHVDTRHWARRLFPDDDDVLPLGRSDEGADYIVDWRAFPQDSGARWVRWRTAEEFAGYSAAYLPWLPARRASGRAKLLYRRPTFSGARGWFDNLTLYAPGLSTSAADVLAVLEAEAPKDHRPKRGRIDSAARRLIETARSRGWMTCVPPRAKDEGAGDATREARDGAVRFDGAGRYAFRRTLAGGLREHVVCDGETVVHLYPEIGLGARRRVSRYHRAGLLAAAPWLVAPADDLAVGADVTCAGERTVLITPLRAKRAEPATQPAKYLTAHLIFAKDGRLAERRLVVMPDSKTLLRRTFAADGAVRTYGPKGKLLAEWKGRLRPAPAPDLTPDVRELVVLPMPIRSPEHAVKTRKLDLKQCAKWSEADALAYLAATPLSLAGGQAGKDVIEKRFLAKGDTRLGFHVLLQAKGYWAELPKALCNRPLAKYVAACRTLDKSSKADALKALAAEGGSFLHRLAGFRYHWHELTAHGKESMTAARRAAALKWANESAPSAFTWAVPAQIAKQGSVAKEQLAALSAAFDRHEELGAFRFAARYEAARWLFRAPNGAEPARKRFKALLEEQFGAGRLPAFDGDLRSALHGRGWRALILGAARKFVEKNARPAALVLAWQCKEAGDASLGGELADLAVANAPAKQRLALTLAAFAYHRGAEHWDRADVLVGELLADERLAKQPAMWHAAADVAGKCGRTASAAHRLDRAIDLAYADLPEKVNLKRVRRDYGELLSRYEALAKAVATLSPETVRGVVTGVVRAADRWRALDSDPTAACRSAAAALRQLGRDELAWEYLTTPLASKPNESGPWSALAGTLRKQGEAELADRAYATAFEIDPTNAQLLWDRAQLLRSGGNADAARRLYKQIAQGTWGRNYRHVQSRAKRALAQMKD